MMLVYVDDVLHLSHDVKPTMDALRRLCELKPESCGPPTRCLGANVGKCQLEDGRMSCWSMSARDCVQNVAKNVEEELLRENHEGLESKADHWCPQGCRAETDVTPKLSDELENWCQQLIGVLRWACKLGRVDICFLRSHCWRHMQPCQSGVTWRLCAMFSLT
jgi:hypothetical protein